MRIRRAVVCSILASIAVVAVVARSAPGGSKSKKAPIQGWSHIYVRALDAEKTCRFYHQVLGMEFVGWKTDGKKAYYYFESGGARICVGGFPKDPSDYKPKRLSNVYFHLSVDDVGALYERIRNAGYENVTEPRTSLWGGRTFTVYDPNGVALGMTEWVGKSDWQERGELNHHDPFPQQSPHPVHTGKPRSH